jgi:hypothetical protein
MRRPQRTVGLLLSAALIASLSAGVADALPLTQPDATADVNGPVRTIAQAGSVLWIGGSFTQATDPGGDPVSVANLVPIGDVSGRIVASMHIPAVTSSGGGAIVIDSSIGPDGNLYFAGTFTAVDGERRHNVAAIDPLTGALLPFDASSGPAMSVLATASAIFVGGPRLRSFQLDGSATPGYTPPLADVDPLLRGHDTSPNVRDIVPLGADALVVACQCDTFTDRNGTSHVKAAVQIDASTGDVSDWHPAGLPNDSGAFGIAAIVHDDPRSGAPTVYLAAGGSDFTAAYDASSGAQRWRTDTSGSSQAIAWYEGDLVVGGHFDWTQEPGGPSCADNDHPVAGCYHSPKLVAMDPADGNVVVDPGDPWNPGICCRYNGVWALMSDANGGILHVGGEFTRMGGTWVQSGGSWTLRGDASQGFYGRLPDVAAPPPQQETLTVSVSGLATGAVQSAPEGIACPSRCDADFDQGTVVTLTATPDPNATFVGWSGDCAGTAACVVTMDTAMQATATFAPARTGPVCGKLAFVSDRDGNDEIYTMAEDGSELTRITDDPGPDASPSWSPDCSQLVFSSHRSGRWNLYVVNADGSDVHPITFETDADDRMPAWSPTGASIAFVGNRYGHADIFTMSVDGSVVRRITRNLGTDRDPSWGPNDARIAFDSDRSGVFQIYTIGADGRDIAQLTSGPTASRQPSWSRGGTKIAFVGTSTGPEIWWMRRNGTGAVQLTTDPGPSAHPSWAFWAGRLAYATKPPGAGYQVSIIGADGTGARPASDTPLDGADPDWS